MQTHGRGRSDFGAALAALGSLVTAWSLWQPWYSLRIPASVLDQAVQGSSQFGVLGPMIRRGAAVLQQLGPLHASAWQVMTGLPAVLLVISAIAGGAALLALTERASGIGLALVGCGLIGLAAAGYGLLNPPGASGLLHAAWGAHVALAGAGAILLGGLLGGGEQRAGPTVTARSLGSPRVSQAAQPAPEWWDYQDSAPQ